MRPPVPCVGCRLLLLAFRVPKPLEKSFVLSPVFSHLNMEVKVDRPPDHAFDVDPCLQADFLQRRASFSDQDPLL
jgi:hypothetical protein